MQSEGGAPLAVEFHHGNQGLTEILSEWRVLADGCIAPTFASYPEWHECFLRHMSHEPDRTCFCVWRRGRTTVAILPLVCSVETIMGITYRTLRLPQDTQHMPAGDFVVRRGEDPGVLLRMTLEAITGAAGIKWDDVRLEAVSERSCCAVAVEGLHHLRSVVHPRGYQDVIHLKPFDEMVKSLTRRTRSHLRTGRNRVEQAGGAVYATADTIDGLDAAMNVLLDVEASGWKGRAGTAIRSSPRLVSFYRLLAQRFGAHGQCHIHTMVVQGRPIAAEFVLLAANEAFFLKGGYDESFAELGPGNRIISYSLRHYFEHTPVRRINLISDYPYLRMWRPERRPVVDLRVFNSTMTGTIGYGGALSLNARHVCHGDSLVRWTKRARRRLHRINETAHSEERCERAAVWQPKS